MIMKEVIAATKANWLQSQGKGIASENCTGHTAPWKEAGGDDILFHQEDSLTV
jgi:hypothetical protein